MKLYLYFILLLMTHNLIANTKESVVLDFLKVHSFIKNNSSHGQIIYFDSNDFDDDLTNQDYFRTCILDHSLKDFSGSLRHFIGLQVKPYKYLLPSISSFFEPQLIKQVDLNTLEITSYGYPFSEDAVMILKKENDELKVHFKIKYDSSSNLENEIKCHFK